MKITCALLVVCPETIRQFLIYSLFSSFHARPCRGRNCEGSDKRKDGRNAPSRYAYHITNLLALPLTIVLVLNLPDCARSTLLTTCSVAVPFGSESLYIFHTLYGESRTRAAARISSAGAHPCEGGTAPYGGQPDHSSSQ
jgi:hypothetical protein